VKTERPQPKSAIALGQYLAVGQNGIEAVEIERRHLGRSQNDTVMRVMKQHGKGSAIQSAPA
jgi:hypothetical protein